MKKTIAYILCLVGMLTASCKKNEVSFTYSPTEPKAGETVKFSNQTAEGEEWHWTFGDGGTSSSKNPSKVYRKAGEYTVTLKVDDKAHRTYTTTITVHDTIPGIGVSDTIVRYFTPVTLTAESYNPYGYSQTFAWHLPESVMIIDGDTSSRRIEVCFLEYGKGIEVSCDLTQGSSSYHLEDTIFVKDCPAPALLMGSIRGIFHQRIYDYGMEEPIAYGIGGSLAPTGLAMRNDILYIFNEDATGDGSIMSFDIAAQKTSVLVKGSTEKQGEKHGLVSTDQVYWSAADKLYKAPVAGENRDLSDEMLLSDAAGIGCGLSAGLTASGLVLHNSTFLYAYGSGIHRFTESEIGGTPAAASILTDREVKCFAIDPIARKIYLCDAEGLSVANMDGSQVVLIDSNANGKAIAIDNRDNQIFWTTDGGVFRAPLVQSGNNSHTTNIEQVNEETDVTAMVIDPTTR